MYQNKKISVMGLGKSGKAAIDLLCKAGARIFVSDISKDSEGYLRDLKNNGIISGYEIGSHSGQVLEAEMIVASPGVNTNIEIVQEAIRRGMDIISELELGYQQLKTTNIIAVTGTNGKTTTVNILHDILKVYKKDVFLCGNVGTPICEIAALTTKNSFVVIEASSYQLELIKDFHATKATVLNVTPDHLYRYRDMQHYADTKFCVFNNQTADDVALLNLDDEYCKKFYSDENIKSSKKTFSLSSKNNKKADIYYENGNIFFEKLGWKFDTKKLKIFGLHNVENVMASVLLLEDVVKNDLGLLDEFLANFPGIEHRLEFVSEINGVRYINDSKSTNVDSTTVALKSFDSNIILMLGGLHKGYSFDCLSDLIRDRVKIIITFGDARDRIAEELKEFSNIIQVRTTFREAVSLSRELAVSGDVVLFSPGCASFDEFKNFEERGQVFKSLVRQ